MAATQTQSTQSGQGSNPKPGETYRCNGCGMEVEITKECHAGDKAGLSCCNQPMQKV